MLHEFEYGNACLILFTSTATYRETKTDAAHMNNIRINEIVYAEKGKYYVPFRFTMFNPIINITRLKK